MTSEESASSCYRQSVDKEAESRRHLCSDYVFVFDIFMQIQTHTYTAILNNHFIMVEKSVFVFHVQTKILTKQPKPKI